MASSAYTRAYTVRGDLCVGALHKAIAVMVVVVVMIIVMSSGSWVVVSSGGW
jgi:hypothetical protein